MIQKIKVGAVSYLNTKPLIYGFEQGMMNEEVDLVIDYPANIASLLLNNQVDIGLVPVEVIPSLPEYHIISDHCIGCDGEVASVCLFSDVPLQEIKTILLDYQSRTSVALLKILLREHWKITPELIPGSGNYENEIGGTVAGLVIGDRALKQRKRSVFIYDLGQAWKELTGLPFVFAAWVSNKQLPEAFCKEFNKATGKGLAYIEDIVATNSFDSFDLKKYYTRFIKFSIEPRMLEALNLFLNKLKDYK